MPPAPCTRGSMMTAALSCACRSSSDRSESSDRCVASALVVPGAMPKAYGLSKRSGSKSSGA